MAGAVTAVRLGVAPNRSRRRKPTSHDAGHIDTGKGRGVRLRGMRGCGRPWRFVATSPWDRLDARQRLGAHRIAEDRGGSPPRAVPAVEALDAILGDGPARDAGAALGAAVGAYLWSSSSTCWRRKFSSANSRKVIHTTSGPFFALTWPLFSSSPAACYFAACVPALQAVRLFGIGSGLIKNETRYER